MATSRDVAKLAGVSQSTVSYVLTGKRPISESTRRRVEGAIEQLTFHPNAGARALASQRTRVIGLVARLGPTSDQLGMWPFVETIARGVREHDHDLLLVTADEGAAGLTRVVRRRIVDALVVMEVEARDERLQVARSLGVPVILIGVPDDPGGLACVDLDFAAAGRLAVQELRDSGCRSVVMLGYCATEVNRGLNYVHRFLGGVQDGTRDLGLPLRLVSPMEAERGAVESALDVALAASENSPRAGWERSHRGGRRRLPGLVVPHTKAIPTVLRALADRGLTPGLDVAVVGMCTDAQAVASELPLSNVSLEPRDVSRRAVETLFHLLGGPPDGSSPHRSEVELVSPRVTRRSTTGPPASP